jgi:membrane associated rhomboid family serine protease
MSPSLDPPDAPWRRDAAAADATLDPELAAAPTVLARFRRALNASLATIVVLALVYIAQDQLFATEAYSVAPRTPAGLWGVLFAPLLHGSVTHLVNNCISVLILGLLAGTVFPKATVRALPLIWLGGGLVTWLIGVDGFHLGASGVTHGLGFLLFGLALLRRDRPAIAAAMIAFFFYGSMLMTVLPVEMGVSWESHLGGALSGLLAAVLWRRADPAPPRKRYSWEDEPDTAEADAEHEPPSPDDVPVLWHRPPPPSVGKVLPFRRRDGEP